MVAQKDVERIETLYLLVHPYWRISQRERLDRNIRTLLEAVTERVRSLHTGKEALIIFQCLHEKSHQENLEGKNGKAYQFLARRIDEMRRAVRNRFFVASPLLLPEVIHQQMQKIQQECRACGAVIDHTTQVIGMGETAMVCVPDAALSVSRYLQSDNPPIVDLAHTNARGRDEWKFGGKDLRRAEAKHPDVVFVPED